MLRMESGTADSEVRRRSRTGSWANFVKKRQESEILERFEKEWVRIDKKLNRQGLSHLRLKIVGAAALFCFTGNTVFQYRVKVYSYKAKNAPRGDWERTFLGSTMKTCKERDVMVPKLNCLEIVP